MACNLCAVADVVAVPDVPLVPADAVQQFELFLSCQRCDDRRDALLDVAAARAAAARRSSRSVGRILRACRRYGWNFVALAARLMSNVGSTTFRFP